MTNTQEHQKTSDAKRRRLQGIVVSTTMEKTAVIRVDRRVAHPKIGKMRTVSKRFKVHDPEKRAHVGDVVVIEETRPISKDKRFRYLSTVTPANA